MTYQPLDQTKNEIRVLRFLNLTTKLSTQDLIQCSIENVPMDSSFDSPLDHKHAQTQIVWDAFTKHVDLRDTTLEQTTLDKPTYLGLCRNSDRPGPPRHTWGDFEALSYTWGDGRDTAKILINGECREVSTNLEKALRALRDLKETGLGMCYWIDSLCINQKDEREKNAQVERMKSIYERARAVIVWLGQEEGMDRDAVATMRHLCRNPCLENPISLPKDLLLNGWPALHAFMQKPYWNRSWIIQELAMNHNSTLILCGEFKLTRRMIRLGIVFFQECLQASEHLSYESEYYKDSDAWSISSRVYRLMYLTRNQSAKGSLDQLLNLVRQADATDKKDKVYGVRGLLDPAISKEITVNYSLRERDVYTNVMKSIVTTKKRLEQIVFGGIHVEEGWPSWVPDWRLSFERNHIRYLRSRRASGNEPAKFEFFEQGNRCRLACYGFKVDTVDGITAPPSSGCGPTQPINDSHRYGDAITGVLQQTLLMGHPASYGKPLLEIPWISEPYDVTSDTDFDSSRTDAQLREPTYFQKFQTFRQNNEKFRIGSQSLRDFFPGSGNERMDVGKYAPRLRLVMLSLKKRALITTRTGYLGLAPDNVRQGDVVVILLGCNFPLVLRPCSHDLFHVIGECYVHGLMEGEFLRQKSEGTLLEQQFVFS